MKVLDQGFVEIKEIHGSDLSIVNNARVSFGKESLELTEKDSKLINYLAKHKHVSPFRSSSILFHIKLPIFVMRQYVKHRMGVEINEISGRYVEFNENEYYVPENFRYQSKDNKQGSAGNFDQITNEIALKSYRYIHAQAFDLYHSYLEMGMAKEMARMILPVSVYTEIRVNMSLEAMVHFIKLRTESHAQLEIQQYGNAIKELALEAFPISMKALLEA